MELLLILFLSFITPNLISNLVINFFQSIWIFYLLKLSFLNMFSSHYYLMVDQFSSLLIIMSLWIFTLVNFMIHNVKTKHYCLFLMKLMMMMILLTFSLTDFFLFYICFEMTILPMSLIILGWGYQPERVSATKYLLMYTIFSSLPFFILMNMNFKFYGTLFMFSPGPFFLKDIFSLMYIMIFLVKKPVFLLHLWLPKAHVEAPSFGSMILAAILLKLGGYGLLRLLMSSLIKFYNMFIPWILWGGVMASLMCMIQTDIKKLIAISSVAHMALSCTSLLSSSYLGVWASLMIMIGHGFSSSMLFFMLGLIYLRMKSRKLTLLKSIYIWSMSFTLIWFFSSASNMSIPPICTLLGEILTATVILQLTFLNILPFVFISLLSGVYSIYIYTILAHSNSEISLGINPLKLKEIFIPLLHFIPLVLTTFFFSMTP